MKPEQNSRTLLSITRSKAKMYEYDVPIEEHIELYRDPAQLFSLSIGLLGDTAAKINSVDLRQYDLTDAENTLQFSAQFFDSYLQTKLNTQLDSYVLLLGSASYYLCNLPGSSSILARHINQATLDLNAMGLEDLLLWLLNITEAVEAIEVPVERGSIFAVPMRAVAEHFFLFYTQGERENELFENLNLFRDLIYQNGTPRQLLFVDVICAVIRKRYLNSTWSCLPRYSNLSHEDWRPIIKTPSFVRELWPAQHLLGREGVFAGNSAVVQMPTSAGKTRAIEIIIRGAFLSGRATTAVIVAPFRALCHEISANLNVAFKNETVEVDEFSDVMQLDLQLGTNASEKQIWVVTPEKLLYILRQVPTLIEKIGLLIYDEGHQFDNDIRGVTYELLLTSLKALVRAEIQKVLISAVINNAPEIQAWLLPNAQVITGLNLVPTQRTVAFTTWLDRRGRLEFVVPTEPEELEFYVPRTIEEHQLKNNPRETKQRVFPSKDDSYSIALYLGLKLVPNGSVAVFCGTKPSAVSCSKKITDVYERNLSIAKPVTFSSADEVQKLTRLHEMNLGSDASSTKSARLGVFTHHNNIPHGLRLAIEYAYKKNLIKFIICTSTLAQGVNLPIRYLILGNVYQAGEQIKVRDFHNLIGRAGRSGIHTEGSIIFADPALYENKETQKWRWEAVKKLLVAENSEPCLSTLLTLFQTIKSDNGRSELVWDDPLKLVRDYVIDSHKVFALIDQFEGDEFSRDKLLKQITEKINIIAAIESYLMIYLRDQDQNDLRDDIAELAMGTFAYHLADDTQKDNLIECFRLLSANIRQRIPQQSKRRVFGRTLFGVWTTLAIERWVSENIEQLLMCSTQEDLISVLWQLLSTNINNSIFNKCEPKTAVKESAKLWIQGVSFTVILTNLRKNQVKIVSTKQQREFTIEQVVELCEHAFSYEGSLVIGAVIEFIGLMEDKQTGKLREDLQKLQKQIKYGLPSAGSVALYEFGFADRTLAVEMNTMFGVVPRKKTDLKVAIRTQGEKLRNLLDLYPAYFQNKLDEFLLS